MKRQGKTGFTDTALFGLVALFGTCGGIILALPTGGLLKLSTDPTAIAQQIPVLWHQLPTAVFLTLIVLYGISILWATNRTTRELAMITLVQASVSAVYYVLELNRWAPELETIYGRRLSPLRYVYWMTSISLLYMIYISAQTVPVRARRLATHFMWIVLMLATGFVWQLSENMWFQMANLSLSMLAWSMLLRSKWASIEMAQSQVRKGNWEIVSPFDTLKRFGCLCWIAYPIINVLGALSLISNEQEEIGQVAADVFSKLVSASMLQSGLVHIASIKSVQEISDLVRQRGPLERVATTRSPEASLLRQRRPRAAQEGAPEGSVAARSENGGLASSSGPSGAFGARNQSAPMSLLAAISALEDSDSSSSSFESRASTPPESMIRRNS